jgi:hypothetical protein
MLEDINARSVGLWPCIVELRCAGTAWKWRQSAATLKSSGAPGTVTRGTVLVPLRRGELLSLHKPSPTPKPPYGGCLKPYSI